MDAACVCVCACASEKAGLLDPNRITLIFFCSVPGYTCSDEGFLLLRQDCLSESDWDCRELQEGISLCVCVSVCGGGCTYNRRCYMKNVRQIAEHFIVKGLLKANM